MFKLHLVVVVGLHAIVSVPVVLLLWVRGWTWAVPLYLLGVTVSLLLLKPWDRERFLWYLEETNPTLREGLISLYELVRDGVKHPAVERLRAEMAAIPIGYRPNLRALLPFLLLSTVFLLLALVPVPKRPHVLFYPEYYEILSNDTLNLYGVEVGDTLKVFLKPGRGGASFLLIVKGEVRREVRVEGSARIWGLPPGTYILTVKGRSGKATLKVLSRPVLYGVSGYIVPPPYTGLSKRAIERENVAYENSTFDSLRIRHSGDSARFVNLPDTLKEDVEVFVEVFKKGVGFRYPAFKVSVIKDHPPSVTLQPTGILKAEEDVPGVVAAYDDIALKEVGLYTYRGGKWERNRLGPPTRTPNASYDLTFTAGDTLKAVAYAYDVAGQISLSDTLILLPKAPEEVLKERLLSEKGEEVKDLERRIRELQEDVEVSRSLSEGTKEEISNVMRETERTYRDIKETLERIASQIRDPELARLVMEVRRLLKESMDRELAEALKRLEKAMREMDPEKVARALKNLRMSQRELKEELERFKRLLERYRQEKTLQSVADRLQDLATKQAEIEGKRSPYEQGKLRSELENLQRKLDSLKRIPDLDRKRLETLEREMRKAAAHMEAAISRMKRGGNFSGEQREARKSLERAASVAQETYDDLVRRRTQEVVERLNAIANAATFADLRLDREPDSNTVRATGEMALDMEATLKDLAKKNVFVSPKLHRLARRIYNEMEAARQELRDGDREGANQHIKQAQSMLRILSTMASSSAQACQNAGGSTGMEAYMKQLARMAGEQGSISRQLFPGMTSEQLAEMLARQMALRKALEGMLEGMRNRGVPGDVLNALEEAVREMRELEEEMRSPDALKKAGELKRRAHRITVRLLEARKALRRQRTEPKYEAQRPKPFKVERAYVRPVIDRERIAEIYRKYVRGGKLSPEERRIYERYIRGILE